MRSCVFSIICMPNQKQYVGHTMNLSARIRDERSKLNLGTHRNLEMVTDWHKYGHDKFRIKILIEDYDGTYLRMRKYAHMQVLWEMAMPLYLEPSPSRRAIQNAHWSCSGAEGIRNFLLNLSMENVDRDAAFEKYQEYCLALPDEIAPIATQFVFDEIYPREKTFHD